MTRTYVVVPDERERRNNDARVYDPRSDTEDVALRALVRMIQDGIWWEELEELGLPRFGVELPIKLLTVKYGTVKENMPVWRSDELMTVLRSTVPALIPAARSMQGLYRVVTGFNGVVARHGVAA